MGVTSLKRSSINNSFKYNDALAGNAPALPKFWAMAATSPFHYTSLDGATWSSITNTPRTPSARQVCTKNPEGQYAFYDGGSPFSGGTQTLYFGTDPLDWSLCAITDVSGGASRFNSGHIGNNYDYYPRGVLTLLNGTRVMYGLESQTTNTAVSLIYANTAINQMVNTANNPVWFTLWSMATNGTTIVAAGGQNGGTQYCMTAPYANTAVGVAKAKWTFQTLATAGTATLVAFGAGVFVIYAGQFLQSSTDGVTWTNRLNVAGLTDLQWIQAAGIFVAVGASGQIYTSTNGTSWTNKTVANGNSFQAVAGTVGMIIAVGDSGLAYRSINDGVTWTSFATFGTQEMKGLYFG